MRWSLKDTLSTILVGAIVAPYVGYLARGSVPFVEDVASMAGAGIVLGLLAFLVGVRPKEYGTGRYLLMMTAGGLSTLALGVASFSTESPGVLAAFMASTSAMWLVTTLHHVRAGSSREVPRITGSAVVNAPLESVFEFVADERNEPLFNTRVSRVEKVTEGPIGMGTRFEAVTGPSFWSTNLVIEYTTFEAPKLIASTTRTTNAVINGTVTFAATPGGTRIDWSWEIGMKGVSRVFSWVVWLIGSRQERANWESLRRHLEVSSTT